MKRSESSLRPLTEKEIQEKLYGAYREEEESGVKEGMKSVLAPPPRRKEKIYFSFPRRKVLSILSKGLKGLLKFSRNLLSKWAKGWGLSLLGVALLFLGIHVLNQYRAQAMKAPRSVAIRAVSPPRAPRVSPLEAPTKEEIPPPEKKPAPLPPSPKPYVIQVCTYANQTDAEGLAAKMKAAELPAFVEPMGRAGGKTFYPVFLGRFETFQEAQARLKEFRGKPVSRDFQDSFIRTL